MALLTWLKARVQKPGSRGGHGYFDAKGEWRYGSRPAPTAKLTLPEGRLSVEMRRQKSIRFRGQRIEGAEDVAAAFRGMVDIDRERLWSVSVDRHQRILGIECVSIGTVNESHAAAREIFKSPMALGAARIFLVHNHPGGMSQPSSADRFLIDALRAVGARMQIGVDGVVVARDGYATVGAPWDSPERVEPFPAAADPGRYAPAEVDVIRQMTFAGGHSLRSAHEVAVLGRALLDPGERTVAVLPTDNRGRVLGAFSLGTNLGRPIAAVVDGYLRTMVAYSPTSVLFAAGHNGPAWSGDGDLRRGLLGGWVGELKHASEQLGIPVMDCVVVDRTAYHAWPESLLPELKGGAREQPFGKAFTFKPAEPAGKIALGKTRAGKAVFASGAESGGYSDADHQDAAHVHAAATAHHEHLATAHRTSADGGGDDWKLSEAHHKAAESHDALAKHHFGLVRQHLVAGGHGGEVALELQGKTPKLGMMRRHPSAARKAAQDALAKRTHHDHPGGVTDADKAAYARFPAPAADGAGKAKPPAKSAPTARALRFTPRADEATSG